MTGAEADLSAYVEPLEVARGLVRLGVPVFTAKSKGGGGFYYPENWQRTRPDETVIDRWRPGMALCAVTGVVFDVIDVDPQNGGLASFQEIHGLMPWSYGFVMTPSTGWHAWIKSLGLHKKPIRAGIDYQAGAPDGTGRGFVFIPPTIRPSKMDGQLNPYIWRTPPYDYATTLATLRADNSGGPLRELIVNTSSSVVTGGDGGYSDPDLEALVTGGIPAGAVQDIVLRDAVWKMVSYGMPDEMVRRTWWEIVRRTVETRPGDPWSDSDLDRHLHGARAKLDRPPSVGELRALLPVTDGGPPANDPLPDDLEQRIAKEQLRLRVQREAREREDAYLAARAAAGEVSREVLDGEAFIFKEIIEVESFWGRGEVVLWPKDEGLMVSGPQGIGKTTIIQNLLLRRVGIGDGDLYGFPVTVEENPDAIYLYLAMDRPAQARRSIRRMISDNPVDRGIVQRYLRFWAGPLPVNVLTRPEVLLNWATAYCGGRVPAAIFCDSYKDLAVGLSEDKVGAAINLAVQACIQAGAQWVGAHHHRKGSQDQRNAPNSLDDVYGSTWLTSGLGSVLMLWGQAGDDAVTLTQLKEPSEKLHTTRLVHDPATGWLTIDAEEQDAVDPLEVIRRAGQLGMTAADLAREVRGDTRRADVVWSQRLLTRMLRDRTVVEGDLAPPTRAGGRPAQRYRLAEHDLPMAGPSADDLRVIYGDDTETG